MQRDVAMLVMLGIIAAALATAAVAATDTAGR